MTSILTDREILELLDPLGGSSPQEIKHAYRSLVRVYHPDVHPDPVVAQKMFIRISDIYQGLCKREGGALTDHQRIFVHGNEGTVERRERGGDNIQVREVFITPDRAYLGGKILVKTREENIHIMIPPMTKNGQTLLFQHKETGLQLLLKLSCVIPVNYPASMKKYLEHMSGHPSSKIRP